MSAKRNSWIVQHEETLIDSPVMQIIRQNCRSSEDDRPFDFYVMRSADWSNIIPVTGSGRVVMVRQYRAGTGEHTLEIPGGVVEAADGDVASAAIREMTEETGYTPLEGARCVDLGWTHPNPAIQDNRCYSFMVGPVRRDREQSLDEGEMIDVVEVPIEEIPRRIREGEIRHALILNAFFSLCLQDAGDGVLRRAMEAFHASFASGGAEGDS